MNMPLEANSLLTLKEINRNHGKNKSIYIRGRKYSS